MNRVNFTLFDYFQDIITQIKKVDIFGNMFE